LVARIFWASADRVARTPRRKDMIMTLYFMKSFGLGVVLTALMAYVLVKIGWE